VPYQRPFAILPSRCSNGKVWRQCIPRSLSPRTTRSGVVYTRNTSKQLRTNDSFKSQSDFFPRFSQLIPFTFCHNTSNLTMAPSAPSLLEYARYHGLAADHLALDLNLNLSAIFDTVQADAPDFCSFIAPPVSLPREGKLRLKKSELQLLAASLQPPPPPSWDEILPDPHRIRNLKLEIPLLQADNEADLQNFSGGLSLDLKDLGVFPDCTDSPSKLFDLASNWDAKLSQEKLQATKEDLMYLQHALQDPYTEEGYQQVLKDALPSYTHVSMNSCVMASQMLHELTLPDRDHFSTRKRQNCSKTNMCKTHTPSARKYRLPPPTCCTAPIKDSLLLGHCWAL
jgi:hypothetical protein